MTAARRRGVMTWWKGRPEPFEALLNATPAPQSWDIYFTRPRYVLHPPTQTMQADIIFFAELPMLGFAPDLMTRCGHHHAIHRSLFEGQGYATLVQSEQMVNWCLAFLEVPSAGVKATRK